MSYFNPKPRKFIMLGLVIAILLLAWPLPAARYCFLCACVSCYVFMSRN